MRRRIDDPLAVGEEVPARRPALAGRDETDVSAIDVHREDLVAVERWSCRLEDQSRAGRVEVRFGVLTAGRELTQGREVTLPRIRRHGRGSGCGCRDRGPCGADSELQ